MQKLRERIKSQLPYDRPQDLNRLKTLPVPGILTDKSIYQYRKQRGVNLGSWFVLERWITDDPFRCAHAPGQSDLDVARGADARKILEDHWDTWIKEDDFTWLAQRGINTVRIPIGYYHLCGADPSVLQKTTFQDFGYVFQGAWSRIVRAIETAEKFGIGVLIDLHAAPGKQNNDAHAGTSDAATFFKDKQSQKHTITVLCSLVRNLAAYHNIVGIELLNEPHPPSDSTLQAWYTSAIRQVRSVDPHMPLYLGECWRTSEYVTFLEKLSHSMGSNGQHALLVIDYHLYRCFTASDTSTSAADHTRALADPNGPTQRTFADAAERLGRAGGGLVVGEWSGALNPGSLRGGSGDSERAAYVGAQLGAYEQHCAGWFFWTYRKKVGWQDAGWSFQDAVGAGVIPGWVGGIRVARGRWERRKEGWRPPVQRDLKEKAIKDHLAYWAQYPGEYEHHRFAEGFDVGWNDAFVFFDAGGRGSGSQALGDVIVVPELGFKGAWARRRTTDLGRGYWEFEHGFMQGVEAAEGQFRNGWGIA